MNVNGEIWSRARAARCCARLARVKLFRRKMQKNLSIATDAMHCQFLHSARCRRISIFPPSTSINQRMRLSQERPKDSSSNWCDLIKIGWTHRRANETCDIDDAAAVDKHIFAFCRHCETWDTGTPNTNIHTGEYELSVLGKLIEIYFRSVSRFFVSFCFLSSQSFFFSAWRYRRIDEKCLPHGWQCKRWAPSAVCRRVCVNVNLFSVRAARATRMFHPFKYRFQTSNSSTDTERRPYIYAFLAFQAKMNLCKCTAYRLWLRCAVLSHTNLHVHTTPHTNTNSEHTNTWIWTATTDYTHIKQIVMLLCKENVINLFSSVYVVNVLAECAHNVRK